MTNHPAPSPASPVALVTGANGRVGATIARTLAANGYAVVIHHRSGAEEARQVRADIRAENGQAAIIKADLANRRQRSALIARAAAVFGPLTLLVNNASSFQPDSARDLDEAIWDSHFAVHAEAPVFLARDFAAQLPVGTEGNIVNIIDERVLHPSPAYFSYTLSKSVLLTATTTLAQSLAPQIRVNAIGPGPVLPHARQTQAEFDRAVAALPLGHHAGPQAIADGVLMLLAARAMTGQMIALDGGQHLEYPARRGPTPRS